jgi:membrane protein involved in colicin uptake
MAMNNGRVIPMSEERQAQLEEQRRANDEARKRRLAALEAEKEERHKADEAKRRAALDAEVERCIGSYRGVLTEVEYKRLESETRLRVVAEWQGRHQRKVAEDVRRLLRG